MNKQIIFKGIATAIVTPFKEENKINFDEFKKLIDFQIVNGIEGIVVCGTTGEASTLSSEEREELIKYCVKVVNRRVPVIAGVGSNNTRLVIDNGKYAEMAGVEGLLVVTPYYNKTTQTGLIEHYKAISENINLPIVLYNVPSRTGIDIKVETYFELSKIRNIVATKEASADISKILKIRNMCKENLNIYSGNDDQILPILSIGGIGGISVLSNIIPKYTVDMVKKYFNNDIKKAEYMQIETSKLIELLFREVNPIPIKEALNICGFEVGKPRMPLIKCSEELKQSLKVEIDKIINKK